MFKNLFQQIKHRTRGQIAKPHEVAPQGIDREFRLLLQAYRRQLRAVAASGNPKGRLGKGRFAKRKSREIIRDNQKGKRFQLPKSLLIKSSFSEDALASGLYPKRKSEWIPILKRRYDKKYDQLVLRNFSFIDHPQNTLDQLAEILKFEGKAANAQLHFDDPYCVDVSAYLALAEMWPHMSKVFKGGRMEMPIQKVVETLKLKKDLSMRLKGLENVDDVWAFPKRSRRRAGTSTSVDRYLHPQSKEKVADEFCEALDEWLAAASEDEVCLAQGGKARLASIIGELLDNAERHSHPPGKDGGWSTAAFMARRLEGDRDVYRCHMGFLSVGSSIAESLARAPISIRAQVNKYTDRHRDCGISRDTLATLVALQDGITSDHAAAANQRGGIGLQEVLELVSALGVSSGTDKGPRMTIVSGSSCIRARAPYLHGTRTGEDEPRMQWFNSGNSPVQPPDASFVFDLESRFPGTIIGLTFVLSKDDLKAVLDAED
ncbi:hypothetical protein C8J36_104143 [Rhizobium sp. PP-F2F-G48]|uniref:hypothetical protein n=1 Tax=Rhizobium sp. PP-F2F-G48 TaxID=2135651 RepID=UPI00104E3079|nr:hypothetical protein [Rhizobium sp. PP-F2F-G48]TCM54951.1 hypothetical protein C8J36_104143 [Rhizobium sp. PP-F2F-G48]